MESVKSFVSLSKSFHSSTESLLGLLSNGLLRPLWTAATSSVFNWSWGALNSTFLLIDAEQCWTEWRTICIRKCHTKGVLGRGNIGASVSRSKFCSTVHLLVTMGKSFALLCFAWPQSFTGHKGIQMLHKVTVRSKWDSIYVNCFVYAANVLSHNI